MCEAPSSAGTQNGPEVSGPYVEMTRNLRHREVAKCLRPMQRSQGVDINTKVLGDHGYCEVRGSIRHRDFSFT